MFLCIAHLANDMMSSMWIACVLLAGGRKPRPAHAVHYDHRLHVQERPGVLARRPTCRLQHYAWLILYCEPCMLHPCSAFCLAFIAVMPPLMAPAWRSAIVPTTQLTLQLTRNPRFARHIFFRERIALWDLHSSRVAACAPASMQQPTASSGRHVALP